MQEFVSERLMSTIFLPLGLGGSSGAVDACLMVSHQSVSINYMWDVPFVVPTSALLVWVWVPHAH